MTNQSISVEMQIVQDAFEFVLGFISSSETLIWRHSARRYRTVDIAQLYSDVASTCKNLMQKRTEAQLELQILINAHHFARSGSSHTSARLAPSTQNKIRSVVILYIQSKSSIHEVSNMLGKLSSRDRTRVGEVLRLMSEAALEIKAETAVVLDKCAQLRNISNNSTRGSSSLLCSGA